MTIRDWILQRTGEAGGEVEGVEFAYSPSSGRSGVGEPVGTPSRVSPGGAEWFSGKTGGGLGLLPLLPFLGNGVTPEGMEDAYNEAYGENAIESSAASEAAQQVRSASGQRTAGQSEQKTKSAEQIRKREELVVPDYVRKETTNPEAIQKGYTPEAIQRISTGTRIGQTLDITKQYPEAQRMETLDITKQYPEAQRMETLDVTQEYPEAQRLEDINQEAAFRSSGAGRTFQVYADAGRKFGETLTKDQQEIEQLKRIRDDPNRGFMERAWAQSVVSKAEHPVQNMLGEMGGYLLAAPVIAGGSAALASGAAAIPAAVQFGAENAANTMSQAVPQVAEKVQQASNVLDFSALARKASSIAAGAGAVISSLSSAAAESSAISSPGASGNWDVAEQKVTGTAKPISTGTVSKSTGITTKISKVK